METIGGYAALTSEYGTALTDQPWYSYVEDVHTQDEAAFSSIFEAVATQSMDAPSSSRLHAATSATSTPSPIPNTPHSNTTTLALGIVLGVFAALVFGGVTTFCLLRRRRRRQQNALDGDRTDDVPNDNGIADVAEEEKGLEAATRNVELASDHDGVELRGELDAHVRSIKSQGRSDPVYELSDGRLWKVMGH